MDANLSSIILENGTAWFTDEIISLSGNDLRKCYQCGKCSAGCPMVFQMDYPPSQLIRLCQLGLRDEVLHSSTIWVCLSCITCSTRCPKDVEIAGLMDTCRELAVREGVATKEQKRIQSFHKSFLETIKSYGRLYEMMLVTNYKLRTLDLMQDVFNGPKMFFDGKLKLLPHGVKDKDAVKKIFETFAHKK
ncbi:MAG: 4Fe-4S dicluster domain-containing protein [Candidatus Brocadiia bacterium]